MIEFAFFQLSEPGRGELANAEYDTYEVARMPTHDLVEEVTEAFREVYPGAAQFRLVLSDGEEPARKREWTTSAYLDDDSQEKLGVKEMEMHVQELIMRWREER